MMSTNCLAPKTNFTEDLGNSPKKTLPHIKKGSDRWTISLCQRHHLEQHEIGEPAFEAKYDLNLRELADEFAQRSPSKTRILSV